MGAGGKMGLRIVRNLKDNADYKTLYVEISDAGKASLAELGLSATPQEEAIAQADVVILALPDKLIGSICDDIVPKLRSGTMVMGLDPAAAYAGPGKRLCQRRSHRPNHLCPGSEVASSHHRADGGSGASTGGDFSLDLLLHYPRGHG